MIIITLARKPTKRATTDCVLHTGCGAINIDATRIPLLTGENTGVKPTKKKGAKGSGGWKNTSEYTGSMNDDWKKGRWPANLLLSTTAKEPLDGQSGILKSPKSYVRKSDGFNNGGYSDKPIIGEKAGTFSINFGDVGGASKYFKIFGDEQ